MANTELSQLVRTGLHTCQVCVPAEFTDAQVRQFADREAPLGGGPAGWRCSEGQLSGRSFRVPCAVRTGFVHMVLVAGT